MAPNIMRIENLLFEEVRRHVREAGGRIESYSKAFIKHGVEYVDVKLRGVDIYDVAEWYGTLPLQRRG